VGVKAKLLGFVDEAHEALGWAVWGAASALVCLGKIDGLTYLALCGLAVVVVAGVERFRGLRLGPGGFELPYEHKGGSSCAPPPPARCERCGGEGCDVCRSA